MKRFYRSVEIYEDNQKFGVKLDGRQVKTQKGNALLCPSRGIAKEVQLEWQNQGAEILPDTMPLMQVITTALDQAKTRRQILDRIAGYVETDLVFFRSGESPYKEKQEEIWGRALRWFENRFRVRLETTERLAPLTQDARLDSAIENYCSGLNDLGLTLYAILLEDSSSNILTMAFMEKELNAEDMFGAIFLDDLIRAEIYDEEKYGAAPDQEKKRNSVRLNLQAAEKLLLDIRN